MPTPLRTTALVLVLVVLIALPTLAQPILNPSFEDETDGLMPNGTDTSFNPVFAMPDHWPWRRQGNMNGHGIGYDHPSVTDGQWALEMFALNNDDHIQGDFLEFYQEVDLTGVDFIVFDVLLEYHHHTASYVAVDGSARWWTSFEGAYPGESVDVSDLTGMHTVALGVMVTSTLYGAGADGITFWDNLRVTGPVPVEARTLAGIRTLFR